MNSYYRVFLAIAVIGAMTVVSGCNQIKLSDKKSGGSTSGSSGGGSSTSTGGGGNQTETPQPPPLQGVWQLTFIFNGKEIPCQLELQQQGGALAGAGQDENGTPWQVSEGTVKGTKVRFIKAYSADRPPIVYTGDIKWLADEHFQGWMMEGNYQTTDPKGGVVSGEWVATPTDPTSMPAPSGPVGNNPDSGPGPGPIDHASNPPPSDSHEEPSHSPSADSGSHNGQGPHLSGRYDGEYEFNFKKIKMKMWLEQDNNRVTGHGVDVNTNEKFVIEKGWYNYPKLTLVRKYFKGTGAAATREFTFKAQVSNGSKGPVLKGETQYGGDWSAYIVR